MSKISVLDFGVSVTKRVAGARMLVSPTFVRSAPSAQTAVDAVPDSWASRLPPPLQGVRAGTAELFEDPRITWAFSRLGGVSDQTVLELGPLEGAHSYMAQQAGARQVTAVEANTKAYLKCLVTKELLKLDRCAFLCGDALEYLTSCSEDFDVCIAAGILYHMTEPARLLDLISQRASRLVMWTHIYDSPVLGSKRLSKRIGPATELEYDGYRHVVHRHRYGFDRSLAGFCGGTRAYSNWMPRDELLRALAHFGWRNIEIGFDEPLHPNGPALALTAVRGS